VYFLKKKDEKRVKQELEHVRGGDSWRKKRRKRMNKRHFGSVKSYAYSVRM
jgi:hypothetical protein